MKVSVGSTMDSTLVATDTMHNAQVPVETQLPIYRRDVIMVM